MRLVGIAILFTVILVIWGVGRMPPGIVRHVINRMSVIGAFVSIGLWIACFVLESSGLFFPSRDGAAYCGNGCSSSA